MTEMDRREKMFAAAVAAGLATASKSATCPDSSANGRMEALLLAKDWVSCVEFSLAVAMVPPPVPVALILALLAIPNSLSLPAPT